MSSNILTIDEIVATIQRSTLPTILVEGSDDFVIYRWIERRVSVANADVLPCGGRTNLFAVLARRREYAHRKTVFVADRDMWVFSSIPPENADVIFSYGYSIENDLYTSSKVESLLEPQEEIDFRRELGLLAEWFAFEVEEFLAGHPAHVNQHPNTILPIGSSMLSQAFLNDRGFHTPSQSTIDFVLAEYKRVMRGKLLLQLLVRFLSAPGRHSKFSINNLHEVCFKLASDTALIDRLLRKIEAGLQ